MNTLFLMGFKVTDIAGRQLGFFRSCMQLQTSYTFPGAALFVQDNTVCVQQSKKSTHLLSLVNIPSCFCKSCQLVLGMHYSSSFPVIQNCYCQRTPSCTSFATSTWTEHHINTSLYLRILADHVHPFITTVFHLPMAASSRIICRVAKLESCQTAFFLEHGEEFTVLQWPPPDITSVEHLWDMAEQEICGTDVQPTNHSKVCEEVMSV